MKVQQLNTMHLWVDGVVPYVFQENVSARVRKRALKSMKTIEDSTCSCVRFVHQTTENDYVLIKSVLGKGCYSSVGKRGRR